ncbi:VWA domain-containing protein [Photobacterium kishitanii]|uniref:VWA domain-containing protein n=1 Tax=Photobacterium kishitanii TaxID=318456 RepID=UPI00273A1E11|nr:VWA domain-containing protein [Photobacterium kishitanii]
MADFTFMHPQWFAALIPLIIVLPWLKGKAQHSGLIAPHLAEKLGLTQQQPKRWPIGLLALGWLIAVIAIAGPSWQKVKLPAYNLSGARVLVMNMSQSMYATDIKPNRLTQERFKALDMLPGWKEGSTGLVAFAGDGYEVSPLTTDSSTLRNLIPSLSPEVMPIAGNNAAKGIAEAIRLLKQAGHNTGDIILMTDGITKTVAQQALAELKGTHYRVSILAMGTVEGAPIQLPSGNLLLENGAPVMSKIDIGTLMSITDSTGGILQMAQATDNDVNAIVNFTAKPLASGKKGHEKELQERLNGGFWLLLPLLLLALLGFRRGIVLAAMFVLLPIDHAQASPWTNTNRQAYEIFTDGHYKQAAQDFTSPQWKGIAEYKAKQYDQAIETLKPLQDPTSQYNLGNAYAQKGDYKQAAATYEKVLQQQPDFSDAKRTWLLLSKLKSNVNNRKNKRNKLIKTSSNNKVSKAIKTSSNNKVSKAIKTSSNNRVSKAIKTSSNNRVSKAIKTSSNNKVSKAIKTSSNNKVSKAIKTSSNNKVSKAIKTNSNNKVSKAIKTSSNNKVSKAIKTNSNNKVSKAIKTSSNNKVSKAIKISSNNN